MTNYFQKVWCNFTHGGGAIERDAEGRINWRCAKCGRWSDHPVSESDERLVIDRELADYRRRRSHGLRCHCGKSAIVNLDGDDLCQDHADQWVCAEGAARSVQ